MAAIIYVSTCFRNNTTANKKEIKQVLKVDICPNINLGASFQTDGIQLIMRYIKIYKKEISITAKIKDTKLDASQK